MSRHHAVRRPLLTASVGAVCRPWLLLLLAAALLFSFPARAVVVWSDLGATLAHNSGPGSDILGGALRRDDTAGDVLYFKFHADPLSDGSTEEYFAAFQLFEQQTERLGIGNSLKAWAYSAFNTTDTGEFNKVFGDMDLRSGRPESSSPGVFLPYEVPRRGIESTIVFKVQYVPGGEDLVTVWLNPDLAPGATEGSQPEHLTTTFKANCSFSEIRLRHGGGGGGWIFSDMAVATAFQDFVSAGSAGPGAGGLGRGTLPVSFRAWQREQGLPQNSVHALAQTRDGYLWVGSDEGVARFDGVRFASFGLREGLRSGRVRVLCADRAGALWIGTVGGGLTRSQNGQFTTYTLRDGLPADSVTALAEDSEGRLWIGTESGLALCQNGRIGPHNAAAELKGKAITTLFRDRRGGMWLGATGAGVFRCSENQFTRLADASVEPLLQDPHCVLEDHAGRLWVGAGDDFVLCREAGQWRRYRIPRHLARPYVNALVEAPDGTLWAGSVSEGLFQFKEGKLAAVNAASGLSDNSVESLLVDREGNLWVGTGAGLNRLQRRNLSAFGQGEGLGYGAVQGLAEVAPGVVWAGKPNDGVYRWGGGSFSRLTGTDLFRRYPEINSLLRAQDGSCWVAAARGLLHFKDPKAAAPEPAEQSGPAPGVRPSSGAATSARQTAPGRTNALADADVAAPEDGRTPGAGPDCSALAGRNVLALAEGRNGTLWAGTREGELWRRDASGTWVAHTNYTQAHAITAIVEEQDGTLWLGTEGAGLHRFPGAAGEHFDKRNGLLSDLIRALYLDSEGALWIGTAGGGLARYHAGRLASITVREGLPDNTISQILEDDSGRLWLGSNRGIACVHKHELRELALGKIPAVYPRVYGRADGMLSEECTGGYFPAGLKTQSGYLWFSTLKGIVVADPHPQKTATPAPNVVLEEVLVDEAPVETKSLVACDPAGEHGKLDARSPSAAPASELRVPPGKRRLEFHYTGLSFSAPERVRFRYQLAGLDPDWMEAGTRRTAFYGYVPPGEYTFKVTACNSDGVWNETGASLKLVVLPHFWQSRWVLALGTLGLLVSVGGAVRVLEKKKHQRRLKHLEQERALERERTRIAQDLHDDLGSSLTRVSLLSDLLRADKDNPAQVESLAGKLNQSAAQTVRALEEIVWALRPGSDTLQSLIEYIAHFANELFEGDAARCRLDLPPNLPAQPLPPEMRHNIFLVVKEALTNALKHANAREVRVQAEATAHSLVILVQDDGRGFELQAPPAPGKRHGLGNMRRRAEAMGGTLEVESIPGKGTTVRLKVNFAR